MLANRRTLLLTAAAVALAAGTTAGCAQGGNANVVSGDMALGPADAKVTVIEYASLACHVCYDFHKQVWPQLKANYVDTGKIRFIFREFPTGNAQIATAEHLLARCMSSTPEQYFRVIDVFFDQQPAVFQAAQSGQIREKLLEIAQTGGLTQERFNQCIADPEQIARLNTVAQEGDRQFKIQGTPTIIINGEVVPNTVEAPYTYEMLAARIDAKLK
jgi:protein-disulfide isomerase